MNAPTAPSTQPAQRGPVRAYESPAYLARQRAAIVAALAEGRTAREIVGDDEDEGEEQGDGETDA